ncbi:MAG TPA: response regulator [Thermomicrobiales bacterium]|nr:response regulator [Thermomicrobiales bacterium]
MARQQPLDQTILVINDSPEFLQLMEDFLGDHGYTVYRKESGVGVFDLVNAHPPDLIVLDLVLGEVDGWAILVGLRADDHTRDIPIIVCSAAADRARQYRGQLHDAAVRVLEKPFDLEHLLAVVIELVGPPGASQVRDATQQRFGSS